MRLVFLKHRRQVLYCNVLDCQDERIRAGPGVVDMGGYVHAAGEGDAFDFRGARVVIKASGDDTFGQLGVMESTYPPGLSVPAHFHAGEDEMFYLLAGELQGFCDDDRWTATPGTFVFVPRDRPHGFIVTSDEPARALVVVGPPALDRQVVANGTPVWRPQPTADREP